MRKAFFLLILGTLISCQDDLPLGFYDHQVVRLLAGGNAAGDMKSWVRTGYVVDGVNRPLEDCSDSIRLLFRIVQTVPFDSIISYELTPTPGCGGPDTVVYGGLRPSAADNIFTDSLIFTGGTLNHILVDQVTSLLFSGRYESDGTRYQVSYRAVSDD